MQLLHPDIQEKIRTLPDDPGVYLMRDEKGVVIYVGKARVLKNRVRQYFGAGAQKQSKTAAMVAKIADFEYIMTDSEKEALILECNLIKQYQPYYNILLRDDKHYPYVRVDLKKDYPTVEIVRRVDKDGAKYFGPYLEAYSVRQVMDAVYKIFPIRSCGKEISEGGRKDRPCLNHQMGRCLAPCAGLVSREEYHKVLLEVCEFLSGKYKKVKDRLLFEMKEAADKLEYEKAAAIRDKLKILNKLAVEQKASFPDLADKDVFAAVCGETCSVIQAFFVRKGKMMGARRFYTELVENQSELLAGFLKQYYIDRQDAPGKVYLNADPEDRELLEEWLRELNGRKVELLVPKRGEMKKLTDMAARNAFEAIKRKEQAEQRQYERSVGAAEKLGVLLSIKNLKRMECYDVSNTQGTDTVASMVVFENGKPNKKEYRRFRIKTVVGADDFASMAEALERRLLEGIKSTDKERGFGASPDLIVVDGGKGQLSSAVTVLESLGLEGIAIVGLAKREEEIFLPHESEPIVLPKNSPEIGLITAIRDEAHRFAITYHRSLREKRTIASELDRIKGVGPKRRALLLNAFGDLAAIKNASVDLLAAVKGVDVMTAREIYQYFNE